VELEGLTPSRKNPQDKWGSSGERKKVLYLKPPERGGNVLPILTMEYDFTRSDPEIRIKVALYTLDEDSNLRVLGLRFEAPEGKGDHNYYHVQFSKGFEPSQYFRGDESSEGESTDAPFPVWLPVKEPTIPISAQNSAELLLCVLASLYGNNELSKFSTKNEWLGQKIKSYLQNMNVVGAGEVCWHRKVVKSGGNEEFQKIKSNKGELEMYLNHIYREESVNNIVKILESEYTQQSDSKKVFVEVTEENGELKISKS
jgi:hypothetical protein